MFAFLIYPTHYHSATLLIMFEFLIYPTHYHSATFHCVGVENTGVN